MGKKYNQIEKQDTIVLAVSADNLSGAEDAANAWGPPFPILYNPDASVIKDYGVFAGKLATPSTFIIDKNGVIRWKYIGGTYDRPPAKTVIQQLEDIRG